MRRKTSDDYINLTNQLVVKINESSDKKYFIIADLAFPDEDPVLVERTNCWLLITKDVKRMLFKSDSGCIRVRDAVGFEEYVWITENGIIISKRRNRLLRLTNDHKGYLRHTTIINRRYRWLIPHRLVASTFVANPENKEQVNHIDGNKLNNHFSNLEWVTGQENILHSIKLGLSKVGSERSSAKLSDEQVRIIRILHSTGETTSALAKMFSVSFDTIKNLCSRLTYKKID